MRLKSLFSLVMSEGNNPIFVLKQRKYNIALVTMDRNLHMECAGMQHGNYWR